MKQFLKEILRDKNHRFSCRELTIGILLLILIISWIAQQFFSKPVPEFMFYTFASLIAAGCFGYSLEKKTDSSQNQN